VLGFICPDVLDRARDQAPEQADELELLTVEGSRFAADERDHSEGLGPLQERRRDPAMQPQLDELPFLRVAGVVHVFSVRRLAASQDIGEQCVPDRPARAARQDDVRSESRDGHHLGRPRLLENDRHPVERDEAAQLPNEGFERLVEVERRTKRPCATR